MSTRKRHRAVDSTLDDMSRAELEKTIRILSTKRQELALQLEDTSHQLETVVDDYVILSRKFDELSRATEKITSDNIHLSRYVMSVVRPMVPSSAPASALASAEEQSALHSLVQLRAGVSAPVQEADSSSH